MPKCVNLEKLTKYVKKNGNKDPRFDTTDESVSPQLVWDIIASGSKIDAQHFLEEVVGNKSVQNKFDFTTFRDEENPIAEISENPEQFIANSVAMKHIVSSIKENEDIAAKNDLTESQKDDLRYRGLMNISGLNLAHVIGRDIGRAFGMVNPKGNQQDIISWYEAIGQSALDNLAEGGLITKTKGSVVNNGYKTKDGKNFEGGNKIIQGQTVYKLILENIDKNIDDNVKEDYPIEVRAFLNKEAFEQGNLKNIIGAKYTGLFVTTETARHVNMMKIPSNLELPVTGDVDVSKFHVNGNGIGVTNFEDNVAKKLFENPLQVDSRLDILFDMLSTSVGSVGYKKMISNLNLTENQASLIFGIVRPDTLDQTESATGQQLSKTVPISDFLDSYESVSGQDLHFRMEIARNSRMHLFETVLNYQSDKNFSRHILTSGEVEVRLFDQHGEPTEVYEHLIKGISDQSKISPEQIEGEDTSNASLEKAIELYDIAFKSDKGTSKSQVNFMKFYSENPVDGMKSGSIWEFLSLISAVSDVRNNDGDVVKTTYMTAPDATASGGMITTLQLIGAFPEANKFLETLGVVPKEDGTYEQQNIKDFYSIIGDHFQSLRDENAESGLPAELQGVEKSILDKLDFIVKMDQKNKERDIYKPPTMTFVYKHGKKGIVKENSHNMAQTFISTMEIKHKNYLIDNLLTDEAIIERVKAAKTQADIANIPGIIEATAEGYKDVSEEMYKALEEKLSNKILKEHNKLIQDSYELLVSVADGDASLIKILGPNPLGSKSEKMSATDKLRTFGNPLTKSFETLLEDGTIIKREFYNQASAFVIPQHLLDAYILKKALARTYKAMKDKGYPMGSMAIHDALESNPYFSLEFEKAYKIEFIGAMANYNIVEGLLDSVKSSGKELTSTQQKELDSITARIEGNRAKNLKALQDVNVANLFGFNGGDVEKVKFTKSGSATVEKIEQQPTTGQSPVVEEAIEAEVEEEVKTETKSDVDTSIPEVFQKESGENTSPINVEPLTLDNVFDFDMNKVGSKENVESINIFFETFIDSGILKDGVISDNVYSTVKDRIEIVRSNKKLSKEEQVETVAHEINHFMMSAYMFSDKTNITDKEVKGINSSIIRLRHLHNKTIHNALLNLKKDGYIKGVGSKIERLIYSLYGPRIMVSDSGVPFTRDKIIDNYKSEVLNLTPDLNAFLEFVAIVDTEEFSDVILEPLGDKKSEEVKSFIARLIEKIKNLFSNGRVKLNSEQLSVLDGVRSMGINAREFRVNNEFYFSENNPMKRSLNMNLHSNPTTSSIGQSPIEEALTYREYEGVNDSSTDPLTATMSRANAAARIFIVSQFQERVSGNNAYSFGRKTHENLKNRFPPYAKTVGYISETYEGNELLQQLVHYINADGFEKDKAKRDFLTIAQNAEQNAIKTSNEESRKVDLMVQRYTGKDKDKISKLYSIWAESSIYGIIDNGMLNDIATGARTIDDAIVELEGKLSNKHMSQAKNISDLITKGEVANRVVTHYNTYDMNLTEDVKDDVDALVALYSLKSTPGSQSGIRHLLNNDKELYNSFVSWNHIMHTMNETVRNSAPEARKKNYNFRQNIIQDSFEVRKEFAIVTRRDLASGTYSSNTGWTILQNPKGSGFGVVYRNVEDESSQSGVGTSSGFQTTDIMVPRKYNSIVKESIDNVISQEIGGEKRYKLVLTKEQKRTLGLIENPAHPMVSAYTRLAMIKDTQVIRDELVKESFTYKLSNNSEAKELSEIIGDKDQDNPWFVKLNKGVIYDDLDKSIQNKYKIITEPISTVNGFKYDVSLVRKDISPWLLGYKEPTPFKDNPNLRQAVFVAKKAVSLMKIHWIQNNPIKIANDLISNETILLAKNVSPVKQFKYMKETMKDLKSLEDLRGKILAAKIATLGELNEKRKAKLQKKEEELKFELDNHPLAFAMQNGMIQSLSTDIVMKNYNTISGLQKSIESVIGKFIRTEDGELNGLGEGILNFSKSGPQLESILNKMSDLTPEDYARAKEFMKDASVRLKDMKSDKEVEKYLSQFFGAPDSEMTRLGSAATQYADVIPRIVLYRHLKDSGIEENQAVKEALETFIDYRVNMPKELKVLSDLGLVLFPSFWMRIQKVILGLSVNNSASIGAGLLFSEIIGDMTGSGGLPHIFHSNVIERTLEGNLMNFSYPILDMVLPTKIAG